MSGRKAAGQGARLDDLIIVALGGNLHPPGGSSREVLEAVLQALPATGIRVTARSRYWRSAAWPNASDPPFLNLAAVVETALGPETLLTALHGIEADFGRVRDRANAPRPIDLDLIAFGRTIRAIAPILPHPRAAERRFVMGPLADIAPDWRDPVTGERAEDLARLAPLGRDAAPLRDGEAGLQSGQRRFI